MGIPANLGIKVGTVHVTCFRPFPSAEIVEALRGVKAFSVVERMDNPLAQSNPLAREIKAAFADALIGQAGYPQIDSIPRVAKATKPFLASTDEMHGTSLSSFPGVYWKRTLR